MKLALATRALFIATLAAAAGAQQALGSMSGQINQRFGTAVITIPDQNGDGVPDLVIGAPGQNSGNGAVHCVSGLQLGMGLAPIVLWTIDFGPSPNPSGFGASLALVGNLVGDATPDFVIGAPTYVTGTTTTGALFLVDGGTHTFASGITGYTNSRLARALATVGDQDGDGLPDLVATTSPTTNSDLRMTFIPSSVLIQSGSLSTLAPTSYVAFTDQTDENLASGFDHDGDGRFDIAVGAPHFSQMDIYRADGSWTFLGSYASGDSSERAAASISAGEDYDNDGVADFLIGAPDWDDGSGLEHGRIIVVSGASILTPAFPPVVITTLTTSPSTPTFSNVHYGTTVRASPDLTGDGVGEILVGSPDYRPLVPFGPRRGAVWIYSGATLAQIGHYVGANFEYVGDVLVPGFHDFNGDGFLDFVAAGSVADTPSTDCGLLKCLSLYPSAATSYCTGKTNSLGCVPAMGSSGTASASSPSPFLVTCSSLINQKSGLFFYSHQPNASSFQGGTLCVKSPLRRTNTQNSGGSATGSDCTGTLAFDFNLQIASGNDPLLVAGAEVFCQCWSRDPAIASTTSLSNGLRFLINP